MLPPPKRPRTDSQTAQAAGDEEFLTRHRFPSRDTPGSVVVTDSDVQHILLSHLAGRASYEIIFETGGPPRSLGQIPRCR